MSDIAAPAAPSTPAPSSSSPAPSGGAKSTPSGPGPGSTPAPASAAPKAPWGDSPLRVKVKMGEVEDFEEIADEDHLRRIAQQARLVGSMGKERKAALARAEAAEKAELERQEALKSKPLDFLRNQKVDVDQLIAEHLAEQARLKALDPETRARELAQAEVERYRREELEPLKAKQAEYERQQKQAAYDRYADAVWAKVQPATESAAAAMGIELDESLWNAVADTTLEWLEAGVRLEPEQILKQVVAADEKAHWGRISKAPGKVIHSKLSQEQIQAIVQIEVAKVRAAKNPAAAPAPKNTEPPAPRKPKQAYIDPEDFAKRMAKFGG